MYIHMDLVSFYVHMIQTFLVIYRPWAVYIQYCMLHAHVLFMYMYICSVLIIVAVKLLL